MVLKMMRWFLPIFFLISGVLGTWFGGRMLLADLNAYQVSSFLDDWAERKTAPSDAAWTVAHGAAERAIAFAPMADADHYDRLGQVHQWQHLGRFYGDGTARASREDALRAYRRAAELRPLWPHAQIRIAQTKLLMLEFDREFDQSVRQALALGAGRVSVYERLVRIGLTAWHELEAPQRELILTAAQDAVAQRPRLAGPILDHAERLRLQGVVCDVLGPDVARCR